MFGIWTGLSVLTRLAIVGGLAVTVLGAATAGYLAWRHSVKMEGYRQALQEVAEQNAAARQAAVGIAVKINDCEARGGSWNVSTGDCDS